MERETLVEAVVSSVAVGLFVVVIAAVGLFDTAISPGIALIGSIVFFVVVMAVAGYWLAGQ